MPWILQEYFAISDIFCDNSGRELNSFKAERKFTIKVHIQMAISKTPFSVVILINIICEQMIIRLKCLSLLPKPTYDLKSRVLYQMARIELSTTHGVLEYVPIYISYSMIWFPFSIHRNWLKYIFRFNHYVFVDDVFHMTFNSRYPHIWTVWSLAETLPNSTLFIE